MKAGRILLAAAVVAGLVAAVWWFEVEGPRREAERLEREATLLDESSELGALTVERGGERHRLERQPDGSWRLESTEVGRTLKADARAVNLAAAALAGSRLEFLERPPGPERLADFGLEPRKLTLTWRAGGEPRSLVLGDAVPPDGARLYCLAGERLATVDRELAVNTAWGSAHWRNKVLLSFPASELQRLEIERPLIAAPGLSARVVLARDPHERGEAGAWRVVEPVDAPAHSVRVPQLVAWLQRLEADGFGPDEPTEAELEAAGLSPPVATLSLELASGERHRLELGRPRELRPEEIERAEDRELLAPVHARLDGGGLVELRPDLAETLVLADDALRDNRALTLPLPRLTAFTFTKPLNRGEPIVLEMRRELDGPWRAVRPAPGRPSPQDASRVLMTLQGVQFGRFEDEIAADPTGFVSAYDLSLPDTFTIELAGVDGEGRPLSLLVEAGPPGAIVRDRDPFRPVQLTDQAGRRTVGVARFRAFDKFLEAAIELHDSLRSGEP